MLYNPRSMNKRGLVKPKGQMTHLVGGAILLNKGGAGVGSSYPTLEEYHRITGRGVLADRIKALLVKPISTKKKNIKFNM
jgi:hypothetical protein